jgi:hypothetical protein
MLAMKITTRPTPQCRTIPPCDFAEPIARFVPRNRNRLLGLLAGLLFCVSITNAATIRKTDDTSITGDITAIADSKLTIKTTTQPVVIPFEEISQVVLKAPPAPAAPPPPPPPVADNAQQDNDDSPGLFGMLFGSGKGHHTEPTADQPAAAQAHQTATTAPTTGPVEAPSVQVTLTDGDALHAKLTAWANQKINLTLSTNAVMEIPSATVTEIWIGSADLQKKAKALTVETGPEDIAFVAKDNDVISVKGLIKGVDSGALQFQYGDEDRRINLTKIVGLLLRSNAPQPLAGFHQAIRFDNGDRLSGTLSAFEKDQITLDTSGGSVKVLTSSITTIDFVNGRVSSLCDLKPSSVEQTPYFGRVIPYQIDHSLTGSPLILSDGTVSRGIAVHSRCVLVYQLAGDVDRFKTRLGFQQPEGLHGRVAARILGDGKVLYDNPDARGDQTPIDIDVSLTGVKQLSLEIDFGKDQDVGDRVVWANPRLIRGK